MNASEFFRRHGVQLIDDSYVFLQFSLVCLEEYKEDFDQNIRINPNDVQYICPVILPEKSKGEQRLHRFQELLETGFEFKPQAFQFEMLKRAIQELWELIVGPEEVSYLRPILMQEFGWKNEQSKKLLLGLAPRQFGKSIFLSQLIAALLIVVPAVKIAVISTGQRISNEMGAKVRKAIGDVIKDPAATDMKQEEILVFHGPQKHKAAKLNLYPSNAMISS